MQVPTERYSIGITNTVKINYSSFMGYIYTKLLTDFNYR